MFDEEYLDLVGDKIVEDKEDSLLVVNLDQLLPEKLDMRKTTKTPALSCWKRRTSLDTY
ncbi:MAG: hypothetical protein GY820_18020 [Gammaproteobacteria bacterium]|nr:hypothetical protein [Gammaproteobacteria bacterium]